MLQNPRHRAYLALGINTLIWGAAMPLVKPTLSTISPFEFLFYRYLLSAILLLPFLLFFLFKSKPSLKFLILVPLIESIILVIGHTLIYLGLDLTSSIQASLISISSPVFITLASILFLKETEERHELAGLVIALIGTLIVTIGPSYDPNHLSSGSITGNLLVFGYVLTWTAYNLLAKKTYHHLPKLFITAYGTWFATLGMGLIIFVQQPQYFQTTNLIPRIIDISYHLPSLVAILYMSILGTIIAIPAFNYGLKLIEASEATLFTYLQPLISIPLAMIWLQETINLSTIIGLALVFSGVFLAEKRTHTAPTQTKLIHP